MGDGARIVVVDDHEAKRYALARTLKASGFEVVEGSSGHDALELAKTQPDAMVVDVRLGDSDGMAIARQIKASPASRGVLILLVSASAISAEEKVLGLESGADAYLAHPFEGAVLVAMVRALVRLRRAQREVEAQRARAASLEQDLEAQREALFKALELVPVPVSVLEPHTARVLFNNRAANQFAGGELAMAQGREEYPAAYALYDASGRRLEAHEMPGPRAANLEPLRGLEFDWQLPSGRRTVLVNSQPLFDRNGVAQMVVLTFEDITAQRAAAAELQKAVTTRDDFISMASHDLRSPLSALHLQMHSLSEAHRLGRLTGERITSTIPKMQGQIERAVRLVEVLFDVTRISAGQLALDLKEFELGELLREVVARNATTLDAARCSLSLELEPGLTGRWDRTRLDQVVQNLLSNAAKYGAGKPIELRAQRRGGEIELSVRDHGVGIPAQEQHRIFQRFERAVADRKIQGLGLGLWIVREIVAAHGGAVSVSSEAGQGAEFIVRLPQAAPGARGEG